LINPLGFSPAGSADWQVKEFLTGATEWLAWKGA
jgi:hypothetical protein